MTDQIEKLTKIREQADSLNIKYHHKAGVDKIKSLIDDHLLLENNMHSSNEIKESKIEAVAEVNATSKFLNTKIKPISAEQHRKTQAVENRRKVGTLIRCNIQCMNPAKKEWPGEILSVGSAKLGTFKKYVPFNSGEPYHIPKIIYDMMVEKKCSSFYTVTDRQGNKVRKSRLISEFAIEVLDPLTPKELKDLANQQALKSGQQGV